MININHHNNLPVTGSQLKELVSDVTSKASRFKGAVGAEKKFKL